MGESFPLAVGSGKPLKTELRLFSEDPIYIKERNYFQLPHKITVQAT